MAISKAAEMILWHEKYHTPISKSDMHQMRDLLKIEGDKEAGKGNYGLWTTALFLFLEVRRLKKLLKNKK